MDSKLKPAGSMTVTYDGKSVELPVFEGTHGPKVVDFRKFYAETGTFTFDPGFTSTASCESQITFIDGDEGTLSIAASATVDVSSVGPAKPQEPQEPQAPLVVPRRVKPKSSSRRPRPVSLRA